MRVIIFVLLSFLSMQAMAQHKQFELPIGWQGNKIELKTISDKNKQHSCVFIVGSDSLRAFLCNNQLRVVREFSLPIKSGEKLLGGMMRDSSLYVFLEYAFKNELHNYAINVLTKKIDESVIPLEIKNEKKVTHISGGNHFLYIIADNKTTTLTAYDFISERNFTPIRHSFTKKQWDDITTGVFTQTVKIEKIDQEGDCDLDAVVNPNKIYIRNDTMLLLMNNHIDSTHVCCYDLKQHSVNCWVIDHHPGQPSAKKASYSDNSFLFRNKLYYVRATADSLLVQVVDPLGGAIINSFSSLSDDLISFKNTPIIQEGSKNRKSDFREVGKTKELLRKMVREAAVITAKPFGNNQIEVVVGSYAKSTGRTGVSPVVMPSATGAPVMIMPAPNFSRESWSRSTHFKMLLNSNNYAHMEGDVGSSINERIERYTNNLKIPPEAEDLFMNNGTYYYAYYDREVRKLVVIKF